MPIAQNPETGEVRRLDDSGQWVATKTAKNPDTGETLAFDGKSWVPLKVQKAEGSVLDYANNLVRSASQGITFGFGDEIAAAGDAAVSKLTGDERGFSELYDENLRRERGLLKKFREDYPVSAAGGEITGAVGGAVATGPAALANRLMAGGTSTLGRMGRAGIAGAGFGGAYGFGAGEDGAAERAENAAKSAGIGAVAGAASVPAIDLVSAGVRKTAQALLDRFGRTEAGQRKVIDALSKAYGGDTRKALAATKAALDKGDDLTIADVGGINAQRQARAVANVPGESSQIADDFVSQRMAGRGGRLQGAADELAPNRLYENLDELTKSQRLRSRPLYDEAFNSDKFVRWDDRLQQFLDDPIVQKGLKRGIRIQQLESLADDVPFNPQSYAVTGFNEAGDPIIGKTANLRAMDAAKRGLDDILEGYRDSTTGKLVLDDMGRAIERVRKSLVSKLDDITTDPKTGQSVYQQARQAYAGPAAAKDALMRGRRFMRGDEEMTAKALSQMTPENKEMFRVGARRAISDLISSDTQAAVTRLADKKDALWSKLRVVFPDSQSFDRFRQGVTAEIDRMRLERFVNPRGGSQTTPLAEDIAELSRVPGWLLDSVEGFKRGNDIIGRVGGALRPLVTNPMEAMRRPNQKVAASIAKTILTMDKKAQDAFFRNADARAMADEVLPILKQGYRDALSAAMSRAAVAQGQ